MLNKQTAFGAFYAALAVVFGAFGAHALEERLSADMLSVFETGVRYHMYHALGLMIIGLLAGNGAVSTKLVWSGRLIHAGIWVFSGSLYVLSLTGIKVLGAVTPLGGVAFIAGWILAAADLWRRR